MYLTIKMLENVANINNYDMVDQAIVFEGQVNSIYFQLFNKSKDLRYMSQASSIEVSLIFPSIDDAKEIEIVASNPFPDDKSIYKIDLTSSQLPNSGGVILKVIEDGVERKFKVDQVIEARLINDGGC